MRALLLPLSAALCLSGCSGSGDTPGPDYRLITDLPQTMNWVLEPAADVIWDSAGYVIDASGETDLSPDTDAAWQQVVNAAATLAESANLLLLPGRSMGSDWNEYAHGLGQAAERALQAAQAQDADALFEAGGRVYTVCRACHNQYWTGSAP
jgi:hypothetical protein